MARVLIAHNSKESLSSYSYATAFPLLELPIVVLEKILSFINDPFDLKALRRCCKTTSDIINRITECLTHLKVTPKDLKDLENIVNNENQIKWNNFRFPPELYYIGCRRQYVNTFNRLFTEFSEVYASHIQTLEMDRFDLSNVCHVNLLGRCQKLKSFKVDAMMLKGISEEKLKEILEDEQILIVLRTIETLDVVAFEFLKHEYQFEFMGKLLHNCTNLKLVGSWGYFPEWEQPIGGRIHLKYFIWPLLSYLRRRIKIVDLMLDNAQDYNDLLERNFHLLNETIDWQAGRWLVDVRNDGDSNFSGIEYFLYSRIRSYAHRAVGWFDEAEFQRCGLCLMTNLSSIHIHNARDINLTGDSPLAKKPLFTKLENLTLIVGNRLSLEDGVPLERVVVDVLLNSYRPSVRNLKLDIDLDHHHEFGSINLSLVLQNFPNLTSLCVEEWGPSDKQLLAVYEAFPGLEVLMFCGRNITDVGILGEYVETTEGATGNGIHKLSRLQILKIFSIRLPPKNIFPWPIKENNLITNLSFQNGFSHLSLRKFHFFLKSEMITVDGMNALVEGEFTQSAVEFLINWLPQGIENVHRFQQLNKTFRFLDPQTFLEPSNFVIPDIGKWVL